jgi:hypothetical protein
MQRCSHASGRHCALVQQLRTRMFVLRTSVRSGLPARAARCLAAPRSWRSVPALATCALHGASAAHGGGSAVVRAAPAAAAAEAPATGAPGAQYPFREVEERWQRHWEEHATFRTPEEVDTTKPKFYALDMFPYPR